MAEVPMVVHALSAGRTLLVEGIGRVWRWRSTSCLAPLDIVRGGAERCRAFGAKEHSALSLWYDTHKNRRIFNVMRYGNVRPDFL